MTKTNNIAITPEAYLFIKDLFTVNGITYGKIPKLYTRGKIADLKTGKTMTNADSVYVRLGDDGKWYQTKINLDADNINYYFNNKPLIDRSNEIIDNLWEQGDGHKIAVNLADARARQQWFTNEDATKFLLTTAGLGALGGGLISAPLATTLGLAGSYVGGKAVDAGMQKATGQTWGQWMNDKTGLPEWFSEFTNPGAIVGGGIGGYKGYKFDESFMNPLINYTQNRGTWYAPAEYITAHTPIGKRAIYTVMNTTDAANPLPAVKRGLADIINKKDFSKASALLKYIFTGKPSKYTIKIAPKTKVSFTNEDFYSSFDNDAIDILPDNLTLTPKKQLVFNSGLDPKYFTEVGGSSEHGILTNYTHNINPQYKNAKVFETNLSKLSKPITDVKSLGKLKQNVEGQISLYNKEGNFNGWYNAAGHNIEVGITPEGLPVERSIDIYKFNPSEYFNKWLTKDPNTKPSKLIDFGLNTIEEATKDNVFIVRTPWYYRQLGALYDSRNH